VLLPVLEDVEQRRARFTRRPQHAGVVLAAPDAASAPERTIQRLGRPDLEARDPTRKGLLVVGFDDDVYVIHLNREMDDAKAMVRRRSDRSTQHLELSDRAERGNLRPRADRDLDRVAILVVGPGTVRHGRSTAFDGWSPGTVSRTTPGLRHRQLQLERLEKGHNPFSSRWRFGCARSGATTVAAAS
jgi:hypothetical protein